jgi:hypothetical protein
MLLCGLTAALIRLYSMKQASVSMYILHDVQYLTTLRYMLVYSVLIIHCMHVCCMHAHTLQGSEEGDAAGYGSPDDPFGDDYVDESEWHK